MISYLLLIFVFGFAHCERCFECSGIDNPNNCTTIKTCGAEEKCSVKQYVTAQGNILYDVDCLATLTCQSLGNIFGKRDARAATDVTTCEECCDGDFCNHQGCGATGLAPVGDRGPLCFACDSATGPDACNQVVTCAKGEECLLYVIPELSGPSQLVYRSMCEPTAACSAISSLHHNAICAPNCCIDDLCNNQCASQTTACDTANGWQQWTDGSTTLCVKVHNEHQNWEDARKTCIADGGDLVVLDNVDKALIARREATADSTLDGQSGIWIGAKDFNDNNQFLWVDNTPVVVANGDWDNGQPNYHDGGHEQDCALMWGGSPTHFQWHDDWCEKRLSFICEK
ncbi:chromatin-modulating protein mrc1 [Mactra antiquata]